MSDCLHPNITQHVLRQQNGLFFMNTVYLGGSISSCCNVKKLMQCTMAKMVTMAPGTLVPLLPSWTFKNKVLYGENSVTTGDIFCTNLSRGLNKPDTMTPKALMVCFETLMKHYDDLKADYEFKVGGKEQTPICLLLNVKIWLCNNRKTIMLLKDLVHVFQISHAIDQPDWKQCLHEATEISEYMEANQEKDVADKKWHAVVN